MESATPSLNKRQDRREQREQQLLALAEQLVHSEGFAALTMERLAALSELSKGTLYNHFDSKEDVLTALSVRSLRKLNQFFALAAHWGETPRQKALALHFSYVLFAKTEPILFLCVFSAATPAVVEKSAQARLCERLDLEQRLLAQSQHIIQSALQRGDIPASFANRLAHMTYLNWGFAFGSNALYQPVQQMGLFHDVRLEDVYLFGINAFFDGLAWQPLSSAHDYDAYWQQCVKQLQPQLLALLISEPL